jgi:hypothetical protein
MNTLITLNQNCIAYKINKVINQILSPHKMIVMRLKIKSQIKKQKLKTN